ncbi:pyridoxamine 5'-phosphate oxidase family protein [Salinarimonas chemoclinalis]|uniref:pyridoxamine 5'-phosphate oxidase family protein n=1 Tax=Salinarimonas chemoclinalis TaxID=3241599 RepID=UPI003556762A
MHTRATPRPPSWARIRVAKRAVDDRAAAYALLDASLFAHIGFIHEGRPMVVPMAFARAGDTLYLHGASKTRIVTLGAGAQLCLEATRVDGLVVARSGFAHSVNYATCIVHGRGRAVEGAELDRALDLITDHLLPGRTGEVRAMTDQERKATGVVALDAEHVTLKVRTGPPNDPESDRAGGTWGGVLPIVTIFGAGEPDDHTPEGTPEPASLAAARARFATAEEVVL